MTMTFDGPEGTRITLAAIRSMASPREAAKALQASRTASWLLPLAVETLSPEGETAGPQPPAAIVHVLDKFGGVFDEPKGLPPKRSHDHRIILTHGAQPVSVRPYRYGHAQKTEIERMVTEMLETGIIRPSASSFSSPVLLVKKKDGTWRFCVDYRALNEVTLKDKHPIPVIDELLDELTGARYFSKLDLRAGYHQIKMADQDVEKTTFRTHDRHYEFLVMPFGLKNAPATFQHCMNDLFRRYLHKFVLVFFDDILVYSATLEEHARHLEVVLKVLRDNNLFAKQSKCTFGQTSIGYLGHIVDEQGVHADPEKLAAVADWPQPKDAKRLRGFLGLTGYYRRFIKGYGSIAAPLTQMLRRNAFEWMDKSLEAFFHLKNALVSAPVLTLPDFTKVFVVETDACDVGVGAVLSQDGHPIAYMSKALTQRAKPFSTYEKEMLAIIVAVEKWRPYLIGRHFIVKTDHASLKHLLQQKISTPTQQRWIARLLCYDFTIEYRKGPENNAADALSRLKEQFLNLSSIRADIWGNIREEQTRDDEIRKLKASTEQNPGSIPHYTIRSNLLCKKDRVVIPKGSQLIRDILWHFHNSATAGHEGVNKTLQRVKSQFWWKGMKADVKQFVKECTTCQREKYEATRPPGHLIPLPIPSRPWTDISMDFIEALPRSEGMETIMVVVDRLTKHAHFVPLPRKHNVGMTAEAFQKNVGRLHGMPQTIVCDRDTVFVSTFWREFMRLAGVRLNFSTAHHPQTDGQTEVTNRTLETYLRCFAGNRPNTWVKCLSWAEWSYNTSHHSAINMTPYEAVYGYPPPPMVPFEPGTAQDAEVERQLRTRDELLQALRDNIAIAQNRMRQHYNKGRADREFDVGSWVWLKRINRKQDILLGQPVSKLTPRFFGPYKVLERLGKAAYRLRLPPQADIHPVFHVTRLKPFVGAPPEDIPPLAEQEPRPVRIIRTRRARRQERLVDEGGGSDTVRPAARTSRPSQAGHPTGQTSAKQPATRRTTAKAPRRQDAPGPARTPRPGAAPKATPGQTAPPAQPSRAGHPPGKPSGERQGAGSSRATSAPFTSSPPQHQATEDSKSRGHGINKGPSPSRIRKPQKDQVDQDPKALTNLDQASAEPTPAGTQTQPELDCSPAPPGQHLPDSTQLDLHPNPTESSAADSPEVKVTHLEIEDLGLSSGPPSPDPAQDEPSFRRMHATDPVTLGASRPRTKAKSKPWLELGSA
ncbi:unnamed protein product [Victoria cruziana]